MPAAVVPAYSSRWVHTTPQALAEACPKLEESGCHRLPPELPPRRRYRTELANGYLPRTAAPCQPISLLPSVLQVVQRHCRIFRFLQTRKRKRGGWVQLEAFSCDQEELKHRGRPDRQQFHPPAPSFPKNCRRPPAHVCHRHL